MELMEDGNLIDKVIILIQRDFEYYKDKQTVLQEIICPGVAGGRLDFPRYASYAAIKLVLWWEDEFLAGFRKNSGLIPQSPKVIQNDSTTDDKAQPVVKKSDPDKFIACVSSSSNQLLEHLHILTQEALDHADLTVLMGTIGATALIRNCLWFYIQLCTENNSKQSHNIEALQMSYKNYQEMGEALAERLLDMHCRLISLYILQDAESLDWENEKPFFESERGSYVIQMWWLYIQGTRQNLWNIAPPKMAQSVFAGILNESLTILAVRYTHAYPAERRNKLLIVDISNLLLCIGQLLPSICNSVDEVIGLNLSSQSKIIRDIHSKCQELFICLFLRGTPLDVLYKIFKKGIESTEIFRSRNSGLSPWMIFGLPHIFEKYPNGVIKSNDLSDNSAIALELFVMLAQPQPNWSLLLKVLGMRNGKVLSILFELSIKFGSTTDVQLHETAKSEICDGFLCTKDETCKFKTFQTSYYTSQNYDELLEALTYILLHIGNDQDYLAIFLPAIERKKQWAQCLDRRQVWNLNYPPWYKQILSLTKPILKSITPIVISAVQTGASMYQAVKIIFASLQQLWDCLDLAVSQIGFLLQDAIPPDVTPIGNSTLLQILISSLYYELVNISDDKNKKGVKFNEGTKGGDDSVKISLKRQLTLEHASSVSSFDGTNTSLEAAAHAIAEALCSVDEDNKHTEEIDNLLEEAKQNLGVNCIKTDGCKRVEQSLQMSEVLVSDLLLTPEGKRSLKVVYNFISCNQEWLLQALGVIERNKNLKPNRTSPEVDNLLHTMFYIGTKSFDQLLTKEWRPNWGSMYQIPMGLNIDRVWNQISKRWEFRDVTSPSLSSHDSRIIVYLTSLFKQT